jgi:hypothetical protein
MVAGDIAAELVAKQKKRSRFWTRRSRKERRKASPEAYEAVGSAAAAAAAAALSDEDDGRVATGARRSPCAPLMAVDVLAQHTLAPLTSVQNDV